MFLITVSRHITAHIKEVIVVIKKYIILFYKISECQDCQQIHAPSTVTNKIVMTQKTWRSKLTDIYINGVRNKNSLLGFVTVTTATQSAVT